MAANEELVDMLDELWQSIDALGAELDEAAWSLPTDCPGWTVKDQLVHLSALELFLLGRPLPTVDVPDDLPHVHNKVGRSNERWIESRRSWSGADALAEFHSVTRERVTNLRALDADGFAADSWTPMGPGTVRDLLGFRIFDTWVHEQDMRRAVGRAGDLDSAAAEHTLAMIAGVMPYIVAKKAEAPDGTTVVFSLDGPLARKIPVGVEGTRGRQLDDVPQSPTATIRMGTETFVCLTNGRIDPERALASGDVVVEGDAPMGEQIVQELNYMF
jgi:uncharacterized protein (TIGR03083 family)